MFSVRQAGQGLASLIFVRHVGLGLREELGRIIIAPYCQYSDSKNSQGAECKSTDIQASIASSAILRATALTLVSTGAINNDSIPNPFAGGGDS